MTALDRDALGLRKLFELTIPDDDCFDDLLERLDGGVEG